MFAWPWPLPFHNLPRGVPMTVYDCSFEHPFDEIEAAVRAGTSEGVIRYACSGHQNGKRLEQPEFDEWIRRGVPVGHVGENTTDPASWDGAEFWRQHLELIAGYPGAERVWPLFFADDGYTDPAHYEWVGQLLDATVVPLELRGIYAGAPHVQWQIDNGHATWGWITNALSWSGAKTYDQAAAMAPSAHLQQLYNQSDIGGTDANRVLRRPCGLWHPDLMAPAPAPTPTPIPTPELNNMDEKAIYDLLLDAHKKFQKDGAEANAAKNTAKTLRLPRDQWAGHVADLLDALAGL
jgi:hypothetical protein